MSGQGQRRDFGEFGGLLPSVHQVSKTLGMEVWPFPFLAGRLVVAEPGGWMASPQEVLAAER